MIMNKKKKLQNLVFKTNLVKYTIGLPILIVNSMRHFILPLLTTYTALYINVTIHPEKIKSTLNIIVKLKKGLRILWQPNELSTGV